MLTALEVVIGGWLRAMLLTFAGCLVAGLVLWAYAKGSDDGYARGYSHRDSEGFIEGVQWGRSHPVEFR